MTKLLFAATLLSSLPASADWASSHPRRAEVNDRLANQHARIHDGIRDGSLSPREARHLRREDHAIRAEERAFAAEHNGHITRGEQRLLNRQENHVSRQIRRDRAD